MLQMIFARRPDGSVAPRTPRTSDGTPRTADGVRTFTLAQAAVAFQMSEAELIALFDEYYGELFPRLQDGEVGNFEPDPKLTAETRRDLLRVVRFHHLTDAEFGAVMDFCETRGLDAWRHVYAESVVGQNGKRELRFITTIDALRCLADRTGQYRGQVGPEYMDEAGTWHGDVWLDRSKPPKAARVGIRRLGFDQPQYATAVFEVYCQYIETPRGTELSEFWARWGAEQLAKCAEALAFKKTFPQALGALLTREEMDQAGNPPPRRPGRPPAPRPTGGDDAIEITDETPSSWREFESVLAGRFRLADEAARRAVIAKLRENIDGAGASVPRSFFARAIRALEDSPGSFGLAA